jgi:predicted metallopeptidase
MFDFTSAMTRLIFHITDVTTDFEHIEPDRVMIAYNQCRSAGINGVYASCQPLRFEGGARTKVFRGRLFEMPTIVQDGVEMMYILYFMLPRFTNLDFETKLTTVFHEVYHMSPKFNGDIRRFKGKNYAHGHSRKVYNERMKALMEDYLTKPGSEELTSFLRFSFHDLTAKYGGVVGTSVRPPRPQPVSIEVTR